MNASSWRKAVDLVVQGTQANQQVQAVATAESNQLESLPLSALSADESSPPQVTYGTEQPLTTITPRTTLTSIPEMQTTDTYHQIIPEEEEDEDPQMAEKQDADDLDMVVYTSDESEEESFNTAIDDTSEDPTIVMGKLVTTAFVSDDVHIPTEKVGCLQVTSQLQEFLNHFPPESKEKAFEQIYQILQMLDAYLIDNLQQH